MLVYESVTTAEYAPYLGVSLNTDFIDIKYQPFWNFVLLAYLSVYIKVT